MFVWFLNPNEHLLNNIASSDRSIPESFAFCNENGSDRPELLIKTITNAELQPVGCAVVTIDIFPETPQKFHAGKSIFCKMPYEIDCYIIAHFSITAGLACEFINKAMIKNS